MQGVIEIYLLVFTLHISKFLNCNIKSCFTVIKMVSLRHCLIVPKILLFQRNFKWPQMQKKVKATTNGRIITNYEFLKSKSSLNQVILKIIFKITFEL